MKYEWKTGLNKSLSVLQSFLEKRNLHLITSLAETLPLVQRKTLAGLHLWRAFPFSQFTAGVVADNDIKSDPEYSPSLKRLGSLIWPTSNVWKSLWNFRCDRSWSEFDWSQTYMTVHIAASWRQHCICPLDSFTTHFHYCKWNSNFEEEKTWQ